MYKPKLYQIITELDDQDMYKYTMSYFIFKNFPNVNVEWDFFNRGKHIFPKGFEEELKNQISGFKNLSFTSEIEANFRKKFITFDKQQLFDDGFYGYMRAFKYNTDEVSLNQQEDIFNANIKGNWLTCKHWETQLMPTMVELNNLMNGYEMRDGDVLKDGKLFVSRKEIEKIIRDKFDGFRKVGAKVADFGLRRRAFKEYQDLMLSIAVNEYPDVLTGTSTVAFSRKYDIKALGTMAHSLNMFLATRYGVRFANEELMRLWVKTYGGSLGTVLPDCFTTDNFLKHFNILFTKLYDSIRHDSGDFRIFTDKIINHYNSKGVDPKSKFIVYNDGINSLKLVEDMLNYRGTEIGKSFGIGTWLTNDIPGILALNIVIKMIKANPFGNEWFHCCKIPDDLGKCTYRDKKTLDKYFEELNLNQFIYSL